MDDCLAYHIISSRCEELEVDMLDWLSSPKRTYKLIDDKMRECIEILKWKGGVWDMQRRLYRIHTRNYFTAREIRLMKKLYKRETKRCQYWGEFDWYNISKLN